VLLPLPETPVITRKYPTGIRIGDEDMASLNLVPDEFHGHWNYTIAPAGSNRAKKRAGRPRNTIPSAWART